MSAYTHADPPPPVLYDSTGLQYHTQKQLGRGGFAICWQAQQTENGRAPSKTVALKIVRSQIEPQKLAQKFVTELQIHSKLHHPNIVEFFRAFSYESSTYVVLEVCLNGSLSNCLKRRTYLCMPEVRRHVIQTCGAVKYLHMHNIVHRDLKTANLFLDQDMNVKVGDFGLAAVLVGPNDAEMRRTTLCGTPNYMAPEILEKGGKGHNEKIDIWAIGIIAYTLAVGKAPFHASKSEEVLAKITKGEYTWPNIANHGNDIPDDLCELVSQILVNEDSRPSLDTIVSNPFFKLGYIPEKLGKDAMISRPKWALNPPTLATIKRGYTEEWFKQCKASGVGEYAPGKLFSAGDSTGGSIYRQCEREAKAGKMPVVPIPDGTVYMPFVYKKGKKDKKDITNGLEKTADRELPATSSYLTESSVNTKRMLPGPIEAPSTKQRAKLQDPVSSVPSRGRPPAPTYAETAQNALRPAALRSTMSKGNLLPAAEPIVAKPFGQYSRIHPAEVTVAESEPKPILIAKRPIRPTRTQSTRTARTTSRNTVQTEARIPEPLGSTQTTTSNTTKPKANLSAPKQPPNSPSHPSTLPISQNPTSPNNPPITISTNPTTILARAQQLRANILTALTSPTSKSPASNNPAPPPTTLPSITKWVDYTQKHGIGYILRSGTTGVLLNASACKPPTHIVVEHGYAYIKANTNPVLKNIPFRFFTQDGEGMVKEEMGMELADRKTNMILWVKFARYMARYLDEKTSIRAQEKAEEEEESVIVRFYQRLGHVGIWYFSNGSIQFNFPDRTKLIVSPSGEYVSFTTLPLPAIEYMNGNATNDLPLHYITARKTVAGSVEELLYGTSTDTDAEIVELTTANNLRGKLGYVVGVLGHWVEGGGLGRKAVGTGREWPVWSSRMMDDGKGEVVESVTVGRVGGD